MNFETNKIFFPSTGVDIVLDIDSDTPRSRASIIYDADYKKQIFIVAQSNPAITPNMSYDQLHLTTISYIKNRKVRVGISCRPIRFINDYPLANKATTKAVVLSYTLPVKEKNIRAAFRLSVNASHTVKGKLQVDNAEYLSDKDFKIKDLSFGGIGMVVAKKRTSDLIGLKVGALLPMGISLVDNKRKTPIATFAIKVRIVRVNKNYSESHILFGLKIEAITPDNEDHLIKFIHEAQIAELKRVSQMG